MSASTVIFYILSTITIVGAVLSVTSLKIFRAAIYLLFSLIGIAGLYFWLDYEFIAAVQVVVYVGGIVVLIIFSIFLTHGSGADMKSPASIRALFSILAVLSGYFLVWRIISLNQFHGTMEETIPMTVNNIGAQMLDTKNYGFLLPFEAVSMLLLAAMIGCIVIAIKSGPESKNRISQ